MSRGRRNTGGHERGGAPRPAPRAPSPAAEAALIIFAKAPIPGQVKTRLCPPLTADEAATLHGSFVLDAVERSREVPSRARTALDRVVFCAPSAEHAFFKVLEARHGVRLAAQTGEDLGARMLRAFQAAFEAGRRRAVLVGTDVPTLPSGACARALALLQDHDLVLGPSTDGGYYLIGLTRAVPELFRDVPWSTATVLSLTEERARALGLRTALLEPRRDIDRIEDLLALIEEGLGTRGKGRGAPRGLISTRTAGVLRTLAERLRTRSTSANT